MPAAVVLVTTKIDEGVARVPPFLSACTPLCVWQAGFARRDYCRNRPLGRDRYGNEYWRFAGDKNLVLVRRHGCWWGIYDGPEKVFCCGTVMYAYP